MGPSQCCPVPQPHHALSAHSRSGCCKVPWLCKMLPALALPHLPEVLGDTVIPPGGRTDSGAGSCLAGRGQGGPCQHSTAQPCVAAALRGSSVLSPPARLQQHTEGLAPSAAALLHVPQHPFPAVLSLFSWQLWPPRAKPAESLPVPLPVLAVVSPARAQQEVLGSSGAAEAGWAQGRSPPTPQQAGPSSIWLSVQTYAPSTTRWHVAIVAVFFIFIFSSVIQIRCFSRCSVLSTFETIFVRYYPL